eukprot:CAMPEP_0180506362 /NCGR_PEP_ID=MMETSP1036_2-20121128/47938_1 /TAXON_ID=632150 /ORGANISM="Azadinium spinosum, Strain 3D9" /LENGTH=140 /DNA_ID=CAMNT_0022516277 /DNA_START=269 /DNA_END=688 /DNA_ORIENTATION=+
MPRQSEALTSAFQYSNACTAPPQLRIALTINGVKASQPLVGASKASSGPPKAAEFKGSATVDMLSAQHPLRQTLSGGRAGVMGAASFASTAELLYKTAVDSCRANGAATRLKAAKLPTSQYSPTRGAKPTEANNAAVAAL